jgi:nucleoid-associated protein YgaU
MSSGRWKKLAIAGAILIVGIGTAWQFRREETEEAPSASKLPETAQPAIAAPGAKKSTQREATFAGRIEPYTGWDDTADRDARQAAAARPAAQKSSPEAEAGPIRPENALQKSGSELTARFASGAGQTAMPADAILQPPAERPPIKFEANAPPGARRTSVDPFAHDRYTASRPAADVRHKIVDGDTLGALARRYLGAAERSGSLFEFNRDVLTTPELLPIGKELRIPPNDFVPPTATPTGPTGPQTRSLTTIVDVPTARQQSGSPATALSPARSLGAASAPARTYVVQPHDTLALIARKLFGDIERQRELMAANRQQLRSPSDLRPGMLLVVPASR